MTNEEYRRWLDGQDRAIPKTGKKTPLKSETTPFEQDVAKVFKELETLLLRKHKDYGPKNISEAPGGAMNGLLVRMHDKISRLKNLAYTSKYSKPQFESLEDTLSDLANYAIIGLLVLRGQWDKKKEDNDVLLKEAMKIWEKQ